MKKSVRAKHRAWYTAELSLLAALECLPVHPMQQESCSQQLKWCCLPVSVINDCSSSAAHHMTAAQVVMFAGGTNDFHVLPPPDLDYWTAQYEAFIQMVSHSHHRHTQPTIHMHGSGQSCSVP